MSSAVRDAVGEMLNRLEVISQENEELTDTDVREAVHRTLNYYFVWGGEPLQIPLRYGMFSSEADQRIRETLRQFIDVARRAADMEGLSYGKARLDALQDPTLRTKGGMIYDELIGHRDFPLPAEPLPAAWFLSSEDDIAGES